jgi:hypothetical protein
MVCNNSQYGIVLHHSVSPRVCSLIVGRFGAITPVIYYLCKSWSEIHHNHTVVKKMWNTTQKIMITIDIYTGFRVLYAAIGVQGRNVLLFVDNFAIHF